MILYKLTNRLHVIPEALQSASTEDALLLMEDAVYAGLDTHQNQQLLNGFKTVYVMKDDLLARGCTALLPQCQQIDFNDFVRLSLEYDNVVSWE